MRRTVKELLVEAKDASELMVDLAYAAVFLGDDKIAEEVLDLEERMDDAVHELRVMSIVAARSLEDAEQMAGILRLVNAVEEVGDAAEDIARVVLSDLGVPGELREDLRHAQEVTARVKLRGDNALAGRSLREAALPSETGMWIIGLRRDVDHRWGPDGDEVLQTGDVLFLQGPAEGVDLVRELAGGEAFGLDAPEEQGRLSNLDRAVDILIEMKDVTEVAVGMAYSALFFSDLGLVREVSSLEDRCDGLYADLQHWVLHAAREEALEDLDELRGLLQIGASAERIADAAQEMTRLAEGTEPVHPVVAMAMQETDEIVADAHVVAGSPAEGETLRALSQETETGMYVLAIERERRWIYRPRGTRTLLAGDRLLVTGPSEGVEQLRSITGDDRPLEDDEAEA